MSTYELTTILAMQSYKAKSQLLIWIIFDDVFSTCYALPRALARDKDILRPPNLFFTFIRAHTTCVPGDFLVCLIPVMFPLVPVPLLSLPICYQLECINMKRASLNFSLKKKT